MLVLAAVTACAVLATILLLLQAIRISDRRSDLRLMESLHGPDASGQTFDPDMVAGLPGPARRYFTYAIASGTALKFAADIRMSGQLALGGREAPNYLPMRGRQVLRIDGFVWRVKAGGPAMWFSGSDGYVAGEGWTRFWLYDLFPLVRAGGGEDFARSAAGRAVAESLFWLPAALLPSDQVRWEPVDGDTCRAIVSLEGHEHRLELTVGADGRPLSVSIMRWSRENPERAWRLQPFGGTIGSIMEVDGYRLAGSVDGGNWFGTADYFPFYRARVATIRLLD